jgi:hypothetical protein
MTFYFLCKFCLIFWYTECPVFTWVEWREYRRYDIQLKDDHHASLIERFEAWFCMLRWTLASDTDPAVKAWSGWWVTLCVQLVLITVHYNFQNSSSHFSACQESLQHKPFSNHWVHELLSVCRIIKLRRVNLSLEHQSWQFKSIFRRWQWGSPKFVLQQILWSRR